MRHWRRKTGLQKNVLEYDILRTAMAANPAPALSGFARPLFPAISLTNGLECCIVFGDHFYLPPF